MESRAKIAGHPIHPMLVVFPIGLLVFSFISDLIYLATGDPAWSNVAYYTMAGGIIGGAAAAIPGAMDLLAMPHSKMRSIGIAHMIINLVVVVLFAINLWMRSNAAPEALGPVWLSGIGVVLLAVSGWLGGEMVYVHGAGVGKIPAASGAGTDKMRPSPSRR